MDKINERIQELGEMFEEEGIHFVLCAIREDGMVRLAAMSDMNKLHGAMIRSFEMIIRLLTQGDVTMSQEDAALVYLAVKSLEDAVKVQNPMSEIN